MKFDHIESDSLGGHVDGAIEMVRHFGSMASSALGIFFRGLGLVFEDRKEVLELPRKDNFQLIKHSVLSQHFKA